MSKSSRLCIVCCKRTEKACAHIDCGNRREQTAREPDETSGHERLLGGGFMARRPTMDEQES